MFKKRIIIWIGSRKYIGLKSTYIGQTAKFRYLNEISFAVTTKIRRFIHDGKYFVLTAIIRRFRAYWH